MSLFIPALLTGIFCYLGAIESPWLFGMSGGFYIVGRPLVAGLLVGIAFGDIKAGVLCGLAVQAVFIANLSTGGATNSEITYAAYGGIGLAMATTKDPAIAVTLAILIGQTFGLIFYNFRMAFYSFWNTRAEKAAENNDDRGIVLNHLVFPQITTFLIRAVPVFLAIYFGKGLVDWLIQSIPDMVTHIIQVLGGVLPALGIAMLMSIVIKNKSHLIFFFAGFVLLAFAKLSMIAIVFIAALVAYMYFYASSSKGGGQAATTAETTQNVDTDDVYEDDDLF
ncbi:PTS mannose/fructose/sorbose/N-acetylgalactosamine transporter subunit IIC [Weissella paramesenteroides]|jgi:mannose/fructose/N-acetylgalactosamine-specific phosphotransferase system component IIC|uniref:PTS sugar transporter subunit IIC n=1 Tax=Weissella paramesenteroides TaxID=1249 RepID=A0ABD4XH55_WEIPA|nr:PTS sugar transporter subunit IIC [Weissella paramesenteroides]KAA8447325.1 PTS sugar transporter subunit IIC [Weissella paramesenteroides]KAA8451157.1 PTS sugar transporter subunit IIC [Weissella paramesenteroides]MDF8366601.1 PTS sugar transporter subunit IIC [Weissella paramesenteroides]MDF8368668.1 PTS sugar transporter subunit IIC [Weissella paramesenteroides]MDF8370560.1 PTS sugar transporter subunit IIC [Weissella paramesenteroides]